MPYTMPPPVVPVDVTEPPKHGRSPLLHVTFEYSPRAQRTPDGTQVPAGYCYLSMTVHEQTSKFKGSRGVTLEFKAPWHRQGTGLDMEGEAYTPYSRLLSNRVVAHSFYTPSERENSADPSIYLLGYRRSLKWHSRCIKTERYIAHPYLPASPESYPVVREEWERIRRTFDGNVMGSLVLFRAWAEAYGRKEWGDPSSPPDALTDESSPGITIGRYKVPGKLGTFARLVNQDFTGMGETQLSLHDSRPQFIPRPDACIVLETLPELELTEAEKAAKPVVRAKRDFGVPFGAIYRKRTLGEYNGPEENRIAIQKVTEDYWVY